MTTENKTIHSIWLDAETDEIRIIDQRKLPHRLVVERIDSIATLVRAIVERHVRGTDLLYTVGAFGIFLASKLAPRTEYRASVDRAAAKLRDTLPGSMSLAAGVNRQLKAMRSGETQADQILIARDEALQIAADNVAQCRRIGQNGLPILARLARERTRGEVVNILTHANYGGLACVSHGTATAPIFAAHEVGIPLHVWIPEGRPELEGSRLTAWEMERQGVDYTVVADSATGHLLQSGQVDVVLTGALFLTADGLVAGQTGTYLNALASADNAVPFYVALSSIAIDWQDASAHLPIPSEHQRSDQIRFARGLLGGELQSVLLTPRSSKAMTIDHDITPPRLVTGIITDRGICSLSGDELLKMYPEQRPISA